MVIEIIVSVAILAIVYLVVRRVSYSGRVQRIARTQERKFAERFENEPEPEKKRQR